MENTSRIISGKMFVFIAETRVFRLPNQIVDKQESFHLVPSRLNLSIQMIGYLAFLDKIASYNTIML
jgi:hypothetical protein